MDFGELGWNLVGKLEGVIISIFLANIVRLDNTNIFNKGNEVWLIKS